MNIRDVPETLDDARVLSVARSAPGVMYYDATGVRVPIHYWALAQYPGDAPRTYRFGVSADHRVICDYLFDSPNEAMQTARENGIVVDDFQPKII